MQNLNTILTPSDALLTGLFKDYKNAEWAYQDLLDRDYKKEDIHLLMSDELREKYFPDTKDAKTGNETLKGIGIGASIGGGLGAIAAAVMAVGTSLAIPALGLVIAGPLAASLAGAGAALPEELWERSWGPALQMKRLKYMKRDLKQAAL